MAGKHSQFGASSASRWRACPGSVRLLASAQADGQRSSYAEEGTAAHALAEAILLGEPLPPHSPEMLEAVQVYVDEVRGHMARLPGAELRVESMTYPLPDRPDVFGTADAIIVEPFGELIVIDYKHGAGVPVEVEGNDQGLQYALGALQAIGDDTQVSSVTIVIVQPRAPHADGPVRRWTVPAATVRAEEALIRSAIAAAETPGAPLIPGIKQCRFCPGKAGRSVVCPALTQLAVQTATDAFEADTPTVRLPDRNDPAQIARALQLQELVELWSKKVREIAHEAAQHGVDIPGWKLVKGSKHRKWRDPAEVKAALAAAKVSPELSHSSPELKSPAQLEKLMGPAWTAQYAVKPEGPPLLVPSSDKRPSIPPTAQTAFDEES